MFRKISLPIIPVLALVLLMAGANETRAQSEREHVRALFFYNLLFFVDWPEGSVGEFIRVGVIGDDLLLEQLSALQRTTVKDKLLIVEPWESGKDADTPFHALFIGTSQRDRLPQILDILACQPVLTVSDMSGFARQGGMVCFAYLGPMDSSQEYRKRFEVNLNVVKRAGLFLRSSFLRIADIVNGP